MKKDSGPELIVIAGPNGAGKSTCSSLYVPSGMAFVNADDIAKTLPGNPSPSVDIQAGRIALEMMDDLEGRKEGFAVETTLATRSLAPRIVRLRRSGYYFHLIYVWSPSADFSIQRVAQRVRSGGHHIPEETIRCRYEAGLKNFFHLYRPIADAWDVIDNIGLEGPHLIARGELGGAFEVLDPILWNIMRERGNDE